MSVRICFVTDYVCPYCYALKIPMMNAVAQLRDQGMHIEVENLPFELTPEPAPQVDTLHDPVRAEKWGRTLKPFLDSCGISMALPPRISPRPYTRLAFEGHFFAAESGHELEWDDAVYHAYFVDELDIGSIDVLCGLAAALTLDADALRAALTQGTYTDRQRRADQYAKEVLGVTNVPTMYFNEVCVVGGLHTVDDFIRMIRDSENSLQRSLSGAACGPDGCQ